MDDELAKKYIMQLLDYNKVKLECINLGWSRNENIKCEIEIIKYCKDYLERITKPKRKMKKGE